jgi:hypothetical protein
VIAGSLSGVATAAILVAAPKPASQGLSVASPDEIAASYSFVQMKLMGKPDAPAFRIPVGYASLEMK